MSNQNFYGSSYEEPNGPRKRDRDWGNEGPPSKRQRDESSTVFLGNLAPDVTEEQIATTFGRCGSIREIRLKRHDDSGKVKGNVPFFTRGLSDQRHCPCVTLISLLSAEHLH